MYRIFEAGPFSMKWLLSRIGKVTEIDGSGQVVFLLNSWTDAMEYEME